MSDHHAGHALHLVIKYIAPTGLAVCTCGQPAEWCLNPLLVSWEWICHDCYYDILEVCDA